MSIENIINTIIEIIIKENLARGKMFAVALIDWYHKYMLSW